MINWKYSSWCERWFNIDRFDHIGLYEQENRPPFVISGDGKDGIYHLGMFDTKKEAMEFLDEFMNP